MRPVIITDQDKTLGQYVKPVGLFQDTMSSLLMADGLETNERARGFGELPTLPGVKGKPDIKI